MWQAFNIIILVTTVENYNHETLHICFLLLLLDLTAFKMFILV